MNKFTSTALSVALGGALVAMLAPNSHAATSIRSKALSTAKAQHGDPYRYGAVGPNAFDCSGLTYYSYRAHGKTLPRTAQGQYNASKKISPSNRQVGDLIFIGKSSRSIYHVGVYAGFWSGKGWMTNANSGSYRGKRVGTYPISEYTAGSPRAYYGRY